MRARSRTRSRARRPRPPGRGRAARAPPGQRSVSSSERPLAARTVARSNDRPMTARRRQQLAGGLPTRRRGARGAARGRRAAGRRTRRPAPRRGPRRRTAGAPRFLDERRHCVRRHPRVLRGRRQAGDVVGREPPERAERHVRHPLDGGRERVAAIVEVLGSPRAARGGAGDPRGDGQGTGGPRATRRPPIGGPRRRRGPGVAGDERGQDRRDRVQEPRPGGGLVVVAGVPRCVREVAADVGWQGDEPLDLAQRRRRQAGQRGWGTRVGEAGAEQLDDRARRRSCPRRRRLGPRGRDRPRTRRLGQRLREPRLADSRLAREHGDSAERRRRVVRGDERGQLRVAPDDGQRAGRTGRAATSVAAAGAGPSTAAACEIGAGRCRRRRTPGRPGSPRTGPSSPPAARRPARARGRRPPPGTGGWHRPGRRPVRAGPSAGAGPVRRADRGRAGETRQRWRRTCRPSASAVVASRSSTSPTSRSTATARVARQSSKSGLSRSEKPARNGPRASEAARRRPAWSPDEAAASRSARST